MDDFLCNVLGLALILGLLEVDLLLLLDSGRVKIFAANCNRLLGGDVHRHIACKLLKVSRASNEVCFAVDFQQDTKATSGVNV